jgi:DNA-binding CsgD family transcriptional regulator
LTAGRIMTEDLDSLTPAIVPWRSLAATAHHQLGAAGEARRLAAEDVDLARQFGAPRALGVALRVQGVVEGGARGLERLQEAAAVLAGSPARLEHARALADLGAALRRAGRPEAEAGEALRRGLELAERCGATILADRLSEELTAAGLRPPRRSRRSPVALTPGEARVAQLAAGGLTNKAVAQQLFVSVRAVEFHLGNVYTKLGISSRRQLAGALASVSG